MAERTGAEVNMSRSESCRVDVVVACRHRGDDLEGGSSCEGVSSVGRKREVGSTGCDEFLVDLRDTKVSYREARAP